GRHRRGRFDRGCGAAGLACCRCIACHFDRGTPPATFPLSSFSSAKVAIMDSEQIAILLVGALAGGIVNGLTGFGTAITALGIWLYALPPPAAASLAIICSVVSQMQTLHLIWRAIQWRRVLIFVIPGVLGVPIGTWLLPHIDPRLFKLGLGFVLVAYPGYVLVRKRSIASPWGGTIADGFIGFGGG